MTHKMISVPDPQVLEMEALDRAFGDWCLEHQDSDIDIDYLEEEWASVDRNSLVFFPDDIDPYDDPEDCAMDLAMERDMAQRIEAKRNIIYRINQGDELL